MTPKLLDELFWGNFDPTHHFRQAIAIGATKEQFSGLLCQFNGLEEAGLFGGLTDEYEAFSLMGLRMLRYQATETFLTTILGAEPHGPQIVFAEEEFRSKSGQYIEGLIDKKVHLEDFLPVSGIATFGHWLTAKVFGSLRVEDKDVLPDDIQNFVSQSAKFFGTRLPYNASKHGGRAGISNLFRIQVADPETEDFELGGIENLVSWMSWNRGKKGKGGFVELGKMECNRMDDFRAILSMSMILNVMKMRRIEKASASGTYTLPAKIGPVKIPKMSKLRWRAT